MLHIEEDQLDELIAESTARAFINDTTFSVFGKGGFSKEVIWLLKQLDILNIKQLVYGEEKPNKDDYLVIGIGDPIIKKAIYTQFYGYTFPNIKAKDCKGEFEMGEGNIICNGNLFTVDIKIGNCNVINLGCTIGHGATIEDYNQINPGTNISGNVKIGNECLIGTGVQILENLSICDNCIIGAGSVVTKNITEPGTYVGVPARKL